jgi:K+-sensing histidine kinase KdpD
MRPQFSLTFRSKQMIARFGVIVASVAATAAAIAVFQRLLGFPPLILFVPPIAALLRMGGPGAALVAAITSAVVGDFFFVEPVGAVTVHAEGLRLLILLVLGAGFP